MVSRVKWCLSVLLAFAAVAAVSAQADIWSAAGFTGIVDEADLNIHQFNSTGSVSIKSSVSSGTLDIRFPVDYSFFNYYVEAQLIKTAAGGNPGPGLMSVQICHTEEQCEP